MLVHFQYKPLHLHSRNPKWAFSFYFKGQFVTGTYHHNGDISWESMPNDEQTQLFLRKAVHDLMLYHVYESEHQPHE